MTKRNKAGWVWAPAIALAALSLCVSVALAAAPRNPQRLTAVFAPWISQGQAVHASQNSGVLVGVGGLPFIMVVASKQPDLEQRLRANGALLVLDGDLPFLCSSTANHPDAL